LWYWKEQGSLSRKFEEEILFIEGDANEDETLVERWD